ncbi:MAG: hypothetical protein ACJ765_13770 [Chloroflexota bacterium]
MTAQHELDLILDAFFVDGTDELADRVIDAALDQIDHTDQRRRMRTPRRFQTMSLPLRFAAAAMIGVIALGGAFLLWKPFQSGVGSQATPAPAWTTTGARAVDAQSLMAVRLDDGRVLVMGGGGPTGASAVAEIYDPRAGAWNATDSMPYPRAFPFATLLKDGRVLVVGGDDPGSFEADLFDPRSGTWTATTPPRQPRGQPSALTLRDGRVLVVGGTSGGASGPQAELYDAVRATWTATAPMQVARANPAMSLLPDGRVLVAGGFAGDIGNTLGETAEIYDPMADIWTETGAMHASRVFAATTVLGDGRVLIVRGGRTGDVYDPATRVWTPTGPMQESYPDDAVVVAATLPDGTVYHTRGGGTGQTYDPGTNQWTRVPSGPSASNVLSATPLLDGRVLIVESSKSGGGGTPSAELLNPAALP